jgi:macrodomain Ter protein organizer (MatP/YcbG family)
MFDGAKKYTEADVDFADRQPEFEMLFDLDADPQEMNNLIKSHAGSEILASLRQRCAERSRDLNQQRTRFTKAVRIEKR